jgi:ribosome-associated protein
MDVDQLHREVQYTAVASSGPGGQHANKVATKVQLELDIYGSLAFAKAEHQRILTALKKQLTKDGMLQLSCQESRSQARNKELVFKKLIGLLKTAARPKKIRKKRRTPAHIKRKRVNEKRKHSEKKERRKFNY